MFVPLVYGISSKPDACAVQRPDPGYTGADILGMCSPVLGESQTCCREEPDPITDKMVSDRA
ncbi:MAG TPA: hypothetical protein VE378_01145 [Nitrososphaeraceae archaeon]|nr:hypothetical protein [Nitrososphaeraceae archaeon]